MVLGLQTSKHHRQGRREEVDRKVFDSLDNNNALIHGYMIELYLLSKTTELPDEFGRAPHPMENCGAYALGTETSGIS